MAGISELLTSELIPWIQHTVTIGAVGALTLWGLNWATRTWQQHPMIEDDFSFSGDEGHLQLTVYNRAAAPLQILSVDVVTPKGMTVRPNGHQAKFESAPWPSQLPPCGPGAVTLPASSELFFVSLPAGNTRGVVKIVMKSHNQRIIQRRNMVSIIFNAA